MQLVFGEKKNKKTYFNAFKTKKGNSIRNETKTKTILSKSLKPKYKYN